MGIERFVVFTGLWPQNVEPEAQPVITAEDFVVCADGGYTVCASLGIKPEAVIGDFDSLKEEHVCEIERLGVERVVHPHDKDDTDTMLCVKFGIARGYDNFLIVGGIGGYFGHTMANVQALSFLTDMECLAEIVTANERLFMVDGETLSVHRETKPAAPVKFAGQPGAKFSVLSYAERSTGVFIKNAKYELDDAVLTQSNPVGVSNEFINVKPVSVSVRYGRLLIIADR